MRKTFVWMAVVALLAVAVVGAQAAPRRQRLHVIGVAHPVSISVNGQPQHFDTPALVVNGHALVPLRGVLQSLGDTVSWHGRTGTVLAQNSQRIQLKVGSREALVGERHVRLATAPRLLGHRFYVPAQFVRETLGASVAWIPSARTVDIAAAAAPSVAGFRSQPTQPEVPEAVPPSESQLQPGQLPAPMVCPPAQQPQVLPPVTQGEATPPASSEQVAPEAAPATQAAVVQVSLSEYKIKLSTDTVPAGPVTLQITNAGKHKHGLDIESTDIKSGLLEPGQSTTLTVTLQPNVYTLYCPVDGHRDLGMKTRLTVR